MLLYLSNLAHYGCIALYSGSAGRKASLMEWIASWISMGTRWKGSLGESPPGKEGLSWVVRASK